MSGIPYNLLIINIPQRFQELDGASPLTAGVRLIPFNALIAVTAVFVNILLMRTGIPCVYFLLLGSIIQVGGLSWFAVLPQDGTLPSTIYGCQVITGFGIGCILGITLLMPPLVVEKKDLGTCAVLVSYYSGLTVREQRFPVRPLFCSVPSGASSVCPSLRLRLTTI
jgi:hypothetical protein